MKSLKKFAVALLTALLVLALLSSAAYIAAESDHDCSGEDCAICMRIEACVHTLRSIMNAFTACAVFAAVYKISAYLVKDLFSAADYAKVPLFKVKLLN
ncbi:MAG: hypothetical protein IJL77_03865 [Clostridia bacterium]|nr:hypothetical protein [Clostridia bacterium]